LDNIKYLELFIEESEEQLQRLNENLLQIESNPESLASVNEIFRVAHTLKGMAGTMGFKVIASLTHSMENTLDAIKSRKLKPTTNVIDLLFSCLDVLDGLLKRVVSNGTDDGIDIDSLVTKLDSLSDTTQLHKSLEINKEETSDLILDDFKVAVAKEAMDKGFIPYYISVKLAADCVLKSARAYVVFKAVEAYGDIIHSNPSVQDIEQEKFTSEFSLVVLARSAKEIITTKLSNIFEVEAVRVEKVPDEVLKIKPNNQENQILNDQMINTENITESKAVERNIKLGKSTRVDIDRLDNLMNLVSELIIIKNRIQGSGKTNDVKALSEAAEYLGKVTTDIHDAVMKVRMVQVDSVFNRFPRVVRDLGKNTGKEVKLNIFGAGTELDRIIADEIGDSLIHLIRNAVDHGLESPEERVASGKSKVGNVDLIAYHDGNNVVIIVGDDGKGIKTEKVAEQIVKKGLLSKELSDQLSEREILNYLFDPRISTAGKVSNISGRGVGMDAVKSKVESLGGVVEIETIRGKGTKFLVKLPLTLSIIQALLIRVANEYYAIPLNVIKEIVTISKNAVKQLRNQETIEYRDSLVSLTRLDKRLNPKKSAEEESSNDLTVIILSKGDRLSAVSVDDLEGQQEIVIKPLGKFMADIKVLSGATILGDGRVVPILDINHLV